MQCKGLLLDKLNEKRNAIIRKDHENELKKKHAENLENMLFAKERELKDAARQIHELIAEESFSQQSREWSKISESSLHN